MVHMNVKWKGRYLFIMQALVGHGRRFMTTNVGCTRRVHDAKVLRNADIYLFGQEGTFILST